MNVRGLAPACLLLMVTAGCGDPELWARYRIEREFWNARRGLERLQLNPRLVTDRDYAGVESAFESIVRHFPPERWARTEGSARATDVALVSGRAALAVARLEEIREHTDPALNAYARVVRDWKAVPAIALEAAIARASALERLGRAGEAIAAWSELATGFPMVDPVRGEAILPVLDAPLRVATARRLSGDRAGADSILIAAEARYTAELDRRHGGRAAPEIWVRLSDARAQRGAYDGAMDALRRALAEPEADRAAPRLVLALSQRALEAGRPDSALAYAAWAERGFDGRAQAEAMMLSGRAWEARGVTDSALAAYQRFLDRYSQAPDAAAQTRFRRGVILENAGRWEQAATEFRLLADSQPTHELGFEALLRIVRHYVSRGQSDLARIEGRRALEQVDRLITIQRDVPVQLLARRTRGELQLALGENSAAFETFSEVWTRSPRTPAGALAGLKAALIAEQQLHDPVRALALNEQLERKAGSADVQRQARAALDRLRAVRN